MQRRIRRLVVKIKHTVRSPRLELTGENLQPICLDLVQ